MNRKDRRKLNKENENRLKKKKVVEYREQKRTLPDTLYDKILYWSVCLTLIIIPFFIIFLNSDYEQIDCKRIKVKTDEVPQIEKISRRGAANLNRIVFFAEDYEKEFIMGGFDKEKYIPVNRLNKLIAGSEIEVEVSQESLDNIHTETFINNYTAVYGIYFENKLVIENHYWISSKKEEKKYKWLIISLLGLTFIPYWFIKRPIIKATLGFGSIGLLCFLVLLLF